MHGGSSWAKWVKNAINLNSTLPKAKNKISTQPNPTHYPIKPNQGVK